MGCVAPGGGGEVDGGGWSKPDSGLFTPGEETRYPLYKRLCGPQGRFGRVRNIVQTVASRYRLRYPGPHQVLLYFQ